MTIKKRNLQKPLSLKVQKAGANFSSELSAPIWAACTAQKILISETDYETARRRAQKSKDAAFVVTSEAAQRLKS